MNQLELPRGCSLIEHSTLEVVTSRLLLPDRIDPKRWEKEWDQREKFARRAYEMAVRYYLSHGDSEPAMTEFLAQRDEETGLTLKILLAQGLSLVGRDRFILTTSNKLGMDATNKEAVFAVGEKMHFGGIMNLRRVTRSVEGDFIGVVLNTGTKTARLKPGSETVATPIQVTSLVESLIMARIAMIREEATGNLDALFTQEEFDQATNWVLFGVPNS